MINHVRTLLRNGVADAAEVWAEYVPETYVPVTLPVRLARVHGLLFDGRSGQRAVNYRLRQIMQLLHVTDLETYVVAKDQRITYMPFDVALWSVNAPEDLTVIASLLHKVLTYEDEVALFGEHPVEPYKTFKTLWLTHPQIQYGLSGLVLALAYRIDEQRGTNV